MWSIITHLIAFTAGTVAGVVLLCLMQAGKMADEGYENMALLSKNEKIANDSAK